MDINDKSSLIKLLKRLWFNIGHTRRKHFSFLLLLMLAVSFAEIISIGAVLPFLTVLTEPDRVFHHPYAQNLIHIADIKTANALILPITVVFTVAALFAGFMRLLLLWASMRLTYAIGADISNDIYRRTLYQPYSVHVSRNSSEIINGITGKTNSSIGIIMLILNLISSSIMLAFILCALMSVDLSVALAVFGGFGVLYLLTSWITRPLLLKNSKRIAYESTQVIKCLQEGLGGIRDILIGRGQSAYCQAYLDADLPLRRSQSTINFIGASPRFVVEALGMILIAVVAFSLSKQSDGIAQSISILGVMAIGAQRLLPLLQQAYAAWSGIKGGQASLCDTLNLLEQELPDHANKLTLDPIAFQTTINLKNLSFRYGLETPWIFKDLNLTIIKGDRVGFIGSTGSGKSTLLDIVMGLLQPVDGVIEIDGQVITVDNSQAWQLHIAHVPQEIFLADSTVEENIAFGVPRHRIDFNKVRRAAQQAQIAESIESWPMQYQTFVGERGVRLSGGQRQRIGIARALYKQADVIIFDEATSALDTETEQAVMTAIENLDKDLTLLIIAHRITTLKNCTRIIELSDGVIKRDGGYQDLVNQSVIAMQKRES